jgi:DNA helicase HerA-like ATPase
MSNWIENKKFQIGTVVGSASTDEYSFILKSRMAKVGDIVATATDIPGHEGKSAAVVWGRIVGIDRFNPFFPAEAAQELADQDINILDTVLSTTRDYLQAEVLIIGSTGTSATTDLRMSPVTYPVRPAAGVFNPPPEIVQRLLTGAEDDSVKLHLGTLIGRGDVEVSLTANKIVSRHLAILAMTGGGKTVAARRVLRELTKIKYPVVIFDPHGDYLSFYEKRKELGGVDVKLFYPSIRVHNDDAGIIEDLIAKMGLKLSEAQKDFFQGVIASTSPEPGEAALHYIRRLQETCEERRRNRDHDNGAAKLNLATVNAVNRSLEFVRRALLAMEKNNSSLRSQPRLQPYQFDEMPDPRFHPFEIVKPGQVSIFYLAGYDHLTQSAIVSIVLEALFAHRATLSERIPPFVTVVEEAHNFIPSRQESQEETPSLATVRKVITEGRKFGTGLIIISQRPARLDETILSQCNSFLVLRLVNPKDKSFVRSVMENLSESDAKILQTFGPGQGIVSGQAVRFPLLVQIEHDKDLESTAIGDEDFVKMATDWKPSEKTETAMKNKGLVDGLRGGSKPEKTVEKAPAAAAAPVRRHLPDVDFNPGKRGRGKPAKPTKTLKTP